MPGTIYIKPLEAQISSSTSPLKNVTPCLRFRIGDSIETTSIQSSGDLNPHWKDIIEMKVQNESFCLVELIDENMGPKETSIGNIQLNLKQIESQKTMREWYDLQNCDNLSCRILLEAKFKDALSHDKDLDLSKTDTPIFSKYESSGPTLEQQESFESFKETLIEDNQNHLQKVSNSNEQRSFKFDDKNFRGEIIKESSSLPQSNQSGLTKSYDFDEVGPTTEQKKL